MSAQAQADGIAGSLAAGCYVPGQTPGLTDDLGQAWANARQEMVPIVVVMDSRQGMEIRRLAVLDFEVFEELLDIA